MAGEPVFRITYWGLTGSMVMPLKGTEITAKVVLAIHKLYEQGRLAKLHEAPDVLSAIRRHVEEGLPFDIRSTYGGNTTCVEVQTPETLFILDCGSGLCELGLALEARWNAPEYQGRRDAHMLVTHPHMDHTFGTPYFRPHFDPRNSFTLWGSGPVLRSLAAVLSPESPLSQIYFPPSYDLMKALKNFHELQGGDDFNIGTTRVRTLGLNHPGGCLGFRLDEGGRAFVFATDHEHPEVPDRRLADFAAGADLIYLDGQYLGTEYEGRVAVPGSQPCARQGWGHSTVEACIATAVEARARRLHLGHHEPRRPDDQIAAIERYAQCLMREDLARHGRGPEECQVLVPHEGMTIEF